MANRRDTLKTLLIGGIAVSAIPSCKPASESQKQEMTSGEGLYGRTDEEKARDKRIMAEPAYFTEAELTTLAILVDIILPADDISGSATEAGVIEFIDFIVKDMEQHQLPLRSGLAWFNRESMDRYDKPFSDVTGSEQLAIIDDIAYPAETKPQYLPGEKFFSRLRNLTLTGFYTSQMGIEALGYRGNRPNFWDGVPNEELVRHGLKYEPKYLEKYIKEEERTKMAQWDDDGNLI